MFFSTFRTSIGRPMRRLNRVCKQSALKPSNTSAVAMRRLPAAAPGQPCVLTVCCCSPHACGRRPYDRHCFKMTMPTRSGGTTAPPSGCCSRTQRKQGGPRLLHLRQSRAPRLTGHYSCGRTITPGSRNAHGPVEIVGPCRERERRVRTPALDPPGLRSSCA